MANAAALLGGEIKTSNIDLGLGGAKLKVTYKPGKITGTRNENLATRFDPDTGEEVEEELDDAESMARSLADIVTAWDFEGPLPMEDEPGFPVGSVVPEGELVPLEPAAIKHIPVPLLVGLIQGLSRDSVPDPTRRKSSRGRS